MTYEFTVSQIVMNILTLYLNYSYLSTKKIKYVLIRVYKHKLIIK